jgi:hypothetical protein
LAFTNQYDTTFPPDTAAANQLGKFLRDFKTDVQQRMAVISGNEAQKPAYAQDAQPIGWNGRIFWATDSGNLYQFSNPGFTNIRSSFPTRQVLKNQTQLNFNQTGTVASIPLPPLTATSRLRISATVQVVASPSPQPAGRQLNFMLNQSLMANIVAMPSPSEYIIMIQVDGGNMGSVGQQSWAVGPVGAGGYALINVFVVNTAVNTSVPTAVNLVWTLQDPADILGFYGMTVEIF